MNFDDDELKIPCTVGMLLKDINTGGLYVVMDIDYKASAICLYHQCGDDWITFREFNKHDWKQQSLLDD